MFERLRNLWRKMIQPTQENPPSAEPESHPRWRRNRKYASRREADRVYRERLKQKTDATNEIAPTECAAPEIFLPVSVEASSLTPQCIDMANGERNSNVEQSGFSFDALRALVKPGPAAKLPAPPVERVPVAEPRIFDVNATANNSPMAAQPIEAIPENFASTEWEPDWTQESRADLPPRDSVHIARLKPFEDDARRKARMLNDHMRVQYQRLRRGWIAPNPQSAIINGDVKHSGVSEWIRRG
jgi:hypothetical protein